MKLFHLLRRGKDALLLPIWFKLLFICSFSGGKKLTIGKNCRFKSWTSCRYSLGEIVIGNNTRLGYPPGPNGEILLQARTANAKISIGEDCYFNNNISIICNERIVIGARCLFGDGVVIYDCDQHNLTPSERHKPCRTTAPVMIEDNVWIGTAAVILKGVHIGENSVIGAGSIVCSDIPANVVAAGNPAVVIKKLIF